MNFSKLKALKFAILDEHEKVWSGCKQCGQNIYYWTVLTKYFEE